MTKNWPLTAEFNVDVLLIQSRTRLLERKHGQLNIDLDQLRRKDVHYQFVMSPNDLVQRCNEAMRLGVDFPTLWHTIIKPDPNVMGPPVQRLDGNRTYLEIPLLRGDWLVIDNEARTVSIR